MVKLPVFTTKKCKTTKPDNKLEKVAVAMHCNLTPSDIAPVVLNVNSASACQISARSGNERLRY